MGEYTDYPADYAEVSSYQSGRQSPAPYATTTLIGSSKLASNDARRFNSNNNSLFYKTDIYPNAAIPAKAVARNNSNNSNSNNYNRSIHSDSYGSNSNNNGNAKMNLMENRVANTMMPNMYNQQHHGIKMSSNKRNRLKLMKPQNIRNYFSPSPNEQLYVKVGEINQIGPHSNSSQQSHTTPTQSTQSDSINWSQHNFNIYENQLHNHHMNGSATMNNEPENNQRHRDDNDDDDDEDEDIKDFIYAGNRSIMSYTSSKDFPENV